MIPRVIHARTGSFSVESLEGRALMCATHDLVGGPALSATPVSAVFDHNTVMPEAAPAPKAGIIALPPVIKPASSTAGIKHPLSSLPDLSSLPNAPATLYLDFSGDYTADWGGFHPGTTPALDQDDDPTTFSDAELATIHETWARVAEDYAPFNLNVTTDDPGNVSDRKTLRVVVGGATSTAWYTSAVAGLGFVGAFTNDLPNTVFVFLNDNPSYMADIISHEAGHGFGLNHQEVYAGNGSLTDPYNDGDAISRPLMGGGGGRAVWWTGPSGSGSSIQDDISVIASADNGFGRRADDYSDSSSSPAAMTLALDGQTRFASGIIGVSTDQDWFAFDTVGGNFTISADVAAQGANLDARLELRDSNGELMRAADSATLGESMNLTLAPGSYRIGVMSRHYNTSANPTRVGDVGQYSLKVQPHSRQPFYGTPFAISAAGATTIQAEDFDLGGQGVSYNDSTPDTNTGGVYRSSEGVDIKTTTDGSTAGFRVGDARPGEWLEYTINVATPGTFKIETRISNINSGGTFHVDVDSNNVTGGSLAVPKTGSWSSYATVSKTGIALSAGEHILRLAFDAGNNVDNAAGGFNWLRLTPTTVSDTTSTRLTTSTSAYVRDGSSSTKNFGSDSQLMAKLSSSGSTRESYLKFDLSQIDIITSAKLRLNGRLSASSTAGVQIGLYGAATTTWSEKGLTWSTRPAVSDPMLSAVTVRGTSSKWYEWDVTEYLKAQKAAGFTTVTLVLRGTAITSPYATFNSDDASSSRPELRIT